MARFPQDQFDEIPDALDRVGAHRAPARKARVWLRLLWAALATVALVAAGLYGLSRINPQFSLDLPDLGDPAAGPTVDPLPIADPVTDPALVPEDLGLYFSILNGSEVPGAENTLGDELLGAGWPDPLRARASTSDVETTTVYYRTADFEGIARGVVEQLGVGRVILSDAYLGAPVTILIGSDYAPAGG